MREILSEGLDIRPTIDLEAVAAFDHSGVAIHRWADIALICSVAKGDHRQILVASRNETRVNEAALEVEGVGVFDSISRSEGEQIEGAQALPGQGTGNVINRSGEGFFAGHGLSTDDGFPIASRLRQRGLAWLAIKHLIGLEIESVLAGIVCAIPRAGLVRGCAIKITAESIFARQFGFANVGCITGLTHVEEAVLVRGGAISLKGQAVVGRSGGLWKGHEKTVLQVDGFLELDFQRAAPCGEAG